MIYTRQHFFLNLRKTTSQTYIRIKNGDTARQYRATLVDGDKVYQLATDCYAQLFAKTSAGETITTNCRILDNKVVFNLTPGLSKTPGYTEAEIRVYSREGELSLTSPRFYFQNEAVLFNEAEPDTPVYAAAVVSINLPSYAWVGDASPYTQVAIIDRAITAHSKVDLQPSKAQLVSFHEHDLAFTTENSGGTVTVIAVGDKPSEDLTMQATITEVS